ncbi:MAG: glycosyltransferase family 4 protein [Thermoproteota archaeon]
MNKIISMKSRKVCILTTVHPSFDTRIFHKEAKTLARSGYDVTLIAQHDRDEVVDGVRIIVLSKPKNRFTRILGLSWQVFWLALRQRADLYHLHDPELLLIGLLLKLFTRAKVIYDVHEDVPQQILTKHWIPSLLRRPTAAIFNIVEKLIARWLDAIITATEGIAENFQGFNVVVVHNYPDLAMFPTSSPPQSLRDERILIYVGEISYLRGAVEMIQALEYLNLPFDIQLELIGRFEPSELEKELRALPGYKRVRFLGWLPPEEIYRRLFRAEIGLACLHPHPSYVMALPVKLFEYMAAGLPVIVSNFPLWKEIVERNKCGLCVDPLNPKKIAEAIEYLLTHPNEAHKMGLSGRRAVEEKYNWGHEARILLDLYTKLTMQTKES